jgi:L-alanine-DL-glutamate epimerase-like enolase superfamily enzyme
MANEKPGGHGERAGAVGLLDAALWDLAAKDAGVPLWRLIADRFNGGAHHARVPVYASGGHYRDGGIPALVEEVRGWRGRGHGRFKIKIGGAALDEDRARLEAVLEAVGAGDALAIDGNGSFDVATAQAYMALAGELGLAWVEEPASPLDYRAHALLAAEYDAPIGTGENIFSAMDTRNLLRHGGLRPDRDRLQMDISLSYGLPEYLRMLDLAEAAGWPRTAFVPHAGHLFAFHVVAGLGLGMHESAPDDGEIYGGLPPGAELADGACTLPDAPGTGIETKSNLNAVFADLVP